MIPAREKDHPKWRFHTFKKCTIEVVHIYSHPEYIPPNFFFTNHIRAPSIDDIVKPGDYDVTDGDGYYHGCLDDENFVEMGGLEKLL